MASSRRSSSRWQVAFFHRHRDDDPDECVPAEEFLAACPAGVRAKMIATLEAVRDAPPPSFCGGGYWEAMHGDMRGYYEVRIDGPRREHFRLFCLLEQDDAARRLGAPTIVLLTGLRKAFRTTFSARDYEAVRALGDEYMRRVPRSIGARA